MSSAYPPAPGQPGHPGQSYPYEQPKKKHTTRNILLILGLLGILACGGCLAVVVGGANEVGKEIEKSIEEEEANDTPSEVTVGEAFTHDDYSVASGWSVKSDGLGGSTVQGTVTNDLDERRSALLDFTFYKGTEVLDEVTCSSKELGKGESSKLDCIGTVGAIKGYDVVKVSDSF